MAEFFDVVVVGSGPAGSAAAILLGRSGFRVALLEAHRDPAHYKRLCTHSIRASALPAIRRLGLQAALDDVGAIRHHENTWTQWGSFHEHAVRDAHGYNIRRVTLDPLIRATAAAVPGVELMMGARARELGIDSSGRIDGVLVDTAGQRRKLAARLVVGADGYKSKIAELAKLAGHISPNSRFCYQAGYRNVPVPDGHSGCGWFRMPAVNYMFANDSGVTMLGAFLPKDRLDEFHGDREAALLASFADLPGGPDLSAAERVSDLIGTTDYPSVTRRRIVGPGVALIGDAAMVGDPLWGTGCGWALQSAEWLASAVTDALHSGNGAVIDAAARRYQRRHRRTLLPHQLINVLFSQQRDFNRLQRVLYRGAARDQRVADQMVAVGTRTSSPVSLFSPALLARAGIAGRRPAPGQSVLHFQRP